MTDTANLVHDFFTDHTKHSYKRGDLIIRAGDPPPGVLYLVRGFVRQSFVSETGEMLVVHVYRPGSYFPMTWVFNETPNRYFFEALTPVEIWRAPVEDVRRFLKVHPEATEEMMRRILRGLTGLMERMEHLVFDSAYCKTILLLLHYAKNFSQKDKAHVKPIPITHKEVAAWIGTTRETASLQIEALKTRGFISYDKRQLIIHDLAKLKKEAARACEER